MLCLRGFELYSRWVPLKIQKTQARSKHKMTGGAERVTHINSPTRLGPSVKAYFLLHVRSLDLSTKPNFPSFVLTLTK